MVSIKLRLTLSTICLIFGLSCKRSDPADDIRLDGSSTVYVLSEAIAEEYLHHKKARISIGVSGTGGGFKKLCSGQINIIGASRTISMGEKELCTKNKIIYQEFEVAYDGIVVAVNKANNFINNINILTLKKLFEPEAEAKIMTWQDLDPTWPPKEIQIFAPGISSGTYDYFTKVINGKEHASRGDINSSEDDNVLVQGIKSNVDSIGFFSFAYYLENQSQLKALFVEGVFPSKDSIQNGSYQPLSRPIFIYVNQKSMSKDTKSKEFLEFYLNNSAKVAPDVGFVPILK